MPARLWGPRMFWARSWPVEGNLTPIWRGQSGNLARFSIWSNLARRNLAWPSQSGQTPGISDKCLRFQSDGRTNLADIRRPKKRDTHLKLAQQTIWQSGGAHNPCNLEIGPNWQTGQKFHLCRNLACKPICDSSSSQSGHCRNLATPASAGL